MNTSRSQQISPLLLVALVILGFVTSFISGYVISRYISPNIITKTIVQNNKVEQKKPSGYEIKTGKHYFVDTIIAITSDAPHVILTATSDRKENVTGGYDQENRVSYFNRKEWARKSIQSSSTHTDVMTDELVKKWSIDVHPSRVLKQSVSGSVSINGDTIAFDVSDLQNEIGMRSLPGYTKFMSQKDGTMSINGTSHNAHILYTRIYSLNIDDIQFYDRPLGLTTYWLAFWDAEGNFYHVDMTSVNNPTEVYGTHQIGIMEDSNKAVYKTFDTQINAGNAQDNVFKASLHSPIDKSFMFKIADKLDKAPNRDYEWYMSPVEGIDVKGFGLLEYIHN